jgi:hypothetical protein
MRLLVEFWTGVALVFIKRCLMNSVDIWHIICAFPLLAFGPTFVCFVYGHPEHNYRVMIRLGIQNTFRLCFVSGFSALPVFDSSVYFICRLLVKLKVKLSLCHGDVWGEWYNSTILDLGIRWRWVAASRPCRFIPGKSPWYPLDRRLDVPQSRSDAME